jgi:hypothetical protein
MANAFDNIGSGSKGYVSAKNITSGNVKLTGIEDVLTRYATLIQIEARRNLNKVNPIYRNDKNATGRLSESISVQPVQYENGNYSITIDLLDYYINVNDGRGAGKRRPPISAIRQWIIAKQLRLKDGGTTKKGYKREGTLISSSKKKVTLGNKKMSILDATAIRIASSIAKKGIKPTYFWDNAINKYTDALKKDVQEILGKDILIIIGS